jgi:HKD family nuclease
MDIQFLTQPNKEFLKTVKEHLINYEEVLIAMAYVTKDGIKEIEKELLQKHSVKIVCGVHGCISDLPELSNLVARSSNIIDIRVFLGVNLFHPKIYVFQKNESAAILVGSSNLTGSGLHSNEEAIVEVIGKPSSKPINDAILYFDNLWNSNSISIQKYLNEHPDYSVKRNINEILTSEQKQKLALAKKTQVHKSIVSFDKKVNKTLFKEGKQTLPTEFNSLIDNHNLCTSGKSVPFNIVLPNREKVQGQIYYGTNNTGVYYQFKLSGSENVTKLKNQISMDHILKHTINLSTKTIDISVG